MTQRFPTNNGIFYCYLVVAYYASLKQESPDQNTGENEAETSNRSIVYAHVDKMRFSLLLVQNVAFL